MRWPKITVVLVLVLALACSGSDDSGGESNSATTAVATSSTDVGAASSDTGPCGTCLEEFNTFLGLSNSPPALCSADLIAWSNLELCLIDCDARFPAPDDEGFCACTLDECAALLDACGDGAAAVCEPGATTGGAGEAG